MWEYIHTRRWTLFVQRRMPARPCCKVASNSRAGSWSPAHNFWERCGLHPCLNLRNERPWSCIVLYKWELNSQLRGCTREQHCYRKQSRYLLWSKRRKSLTHSTRISTSKNSTFSGIVCILRVVGRVSGTSSSAITEQKWNAALGCPLSRIRAYLIGVLFVLYCNICSKRVWHDWTRRE